MAELTVAAALRLTLLLSLPVAVAWIAFTLFLPLRGTGRRALQFGLALIFGPLLAAPSLQLGYSLTGSLEFSSALIGLMTCAIAVLLLAATTRLATGPLVQTSTPEPILPLSTRLQTVLFTATLILISIRLLSILPDLLLQPLLPWDAWKTWAWKARAWFETGGLFPFASSREWASASAEQFVIDGVNHPDLLSLVILWSAVALGHWDDSLLGLPWLMCGLGIALTLFGTLRLVQAPAVVALAAVYLALSLPMLSTHIVLWGYADLWMAGLFAALTTGLVMWVRVPDIRWFILILLATGVMVFAKDTGSYWLPVIAATLIGMTLPTRLLLIATGIGASAIAILFAAGIDPISLVSGGRFRITNQPVGAAVQGIKAHLFIWLDWHLMGYTLIPLLAAAMLRARHSKEIRSLLILVSFSLVTLIAAFVLTRAAQYATIGTLFSRQLLHIIPAIIMLAALTGWDFLKTWQPNSPFHNTFPRFNVKALLAMSLAALLLWGGYTAWTLHGDNFETSYPDMVLLPDPIDWYLIDGEGALGTDGMYIERPGERGNWRLALSLPDPILAQNYGRIEISIGDERPWLPLTLAWSRIPNFTPTRSMPLTPSEDGSVFELALNSAPGWSDEIYFLALESFGPFSEPLRIESVRLIEKAPDFTALQQRLFGGWFNQTGWTQSSAHRTLIGPAPPLVSPVLTAAIWIIVTIGLLVALAGRSLRHHRWWLLAPLVVGWLALDLRWQADLWAKAHLTVRDSASLSLEEKNRAAVDGALYQFAQQLKAEDLEGFSGRVFSFGHNEYQRTRIRYHMLPYSVRNASDRRWTNRFISHVQHGDLIILIDTPLILVTQSDDDIYLIRNRMNKDTELRTRLVFRSGALRAYLVDLES